MRTFGVALLLMGILTLPVQAERVTWVADGDTFKTSSGWVRLWGIDSPEMKQPYGNAAKWHLIGLVKGKDVRLECVDRSYHRRVCRAYLAGEDLSRAMVRAGMAFDYARFSGGHYRNTERYSKRLKRGVWKQIGGGVRPWQFRH